MIGEDKIDIMSIVTPQNIEGKCVFYQVNYSLAANPYSSDSRRMGNDSFFKIAKDDLMDSPKHDLQLGGFGEFFFEAMLILFIDFCDVKKGQKMESNTDFDFVFISMSFYTTIRFSCSLCPFLLSCALYTHWLYS